MEESFETIVIGGGQAGLAAGYFLAQQGKDFVIFDEASRSGESWRNRWDSLRLFTPSQFDGLPGRPFPRPDFYFPTKDEVADYLECYVEQFKLPVRHNVKIDSLSRNDHGYRLTAGNKALSAQNVIVATGAYQKPYTPDFASQLSHDIFQLHSYAYRNPTQIPATNVLIAGAGNSGAEIALDLSKSDKHVWLAGRDVGSIPANTAGRILGGRPYWWFTSHVLSVNTPIGRKARPKMLTQGTPLIRASRKEIAQSGVEFTGRIFGVQSGQPLLENGQTLPIEAIIWATGYRPDFSWINLPIFDQHGYPRHQRGIVLEALGLYFVGLHFQTALSSALLGGVGTDAAYVTSQMN
jgi:putative flavoprotein involved in K+ transport